jgi:hypothetical protein
MEEDNTTVESTTLFPQNLIDIRTKKSNIHGRAAIAKPMSTESNAQTRKRWCHDHETWTSDSRKRARDIVS